MKRGRRFGERNNEQEIFSNSQEHRFAVDLKSAYRTSEKFVNGMTLGAFTRYFRQRESSKNIAFPFSFLSAREILI